jgi:hypothetical protein
MKSMKPNTRWAGLVLFLLIQACGASNLDPSPLPPTSIESSPTPLKIPTVTITMPPLPDFSSHLYFQFGGGADEACYEGDTSPKIDGEVQIDYLVQRKGTLCAYGVPLEKPFYVSLTSPDGETRLEGNFKITDSSDGQKFVWVGHENEENYNEIYLDDNTNTATIRFRLWWAGRLPSGDWKAQVNWQGGEASGVFKVPAYQQPEIYFLDSRSGKDILLSSALYSACHHANDSKNISIGGSNFPSAGLIYLLVYQKIPENGWLTEKVEEQVVPADGTGKFETVLTVSPLPDGEFWVIAGNSSDFVDSNIEESMADFNKIGNAIDCFHVP